MSTPDPNAPQPTPTVTLETLEQDLAALQWKFERRSAPNKQDFLVSGFVSKPDKASVMITFMVSHMFIWVTTQELIMDVPAEVAPVILAANSKLPMGKLFVSRRPLSKDPNKTVNIVEYTFEIADSLYSQKLLAGNLNLLVQNIDWLMHEFLSKQVIDNHQVHFFEGEMPPAGQAPPANPDQSAQNQAPAPGMSGVSKS